MKFFFFRNTESRVYLPLTIIVIVSNLMAIVNDYYPLNKWVFFTIAIATIFSGIFYSGYIKNFS